MASPSREAEQGAPTAPVVVEALSAAKVYPDGTQALAPLDLAVREGEFVTLIGPSGCGKSTLLRMIAGLTGPTAGRVRWAGGLLDAGGAQAGKLAFVFQDPTLMPWARVRANVRLPLDLRGVPRSGSDARVTRALDLVGLSQFGEHYPRQLSGGMQMRASIARALIDEPRLLLMDEPFGALDEITRNRLDEELGALWLRQRFTAVFVTHSIYEAAFLSTRVLVMTSRPGRILGEIAIEEAYPRDQAYRSSERFSAGCGRLSELLAQASRLGSGEA
jgi:NitT/TauT family transport system ATP-binding protein